MKILLIYPPFCNPSTFPYSISYLKEFISANSSYKAKCLDLNAKFHTIKFKEYYEILKKIKIENEKDNNKRCNNDRDSKKNNNNDNKNENNKYKNNYIINFNKEYTQLLEDFTIKSRECYSRNHKAILKGDKPEFFNEILNLILDEKPDIAAFSLVYNSQCFYATSLIEELNKKGIKCIIGGPAVNKKIERKALSLNNAFELLKYLSLNDEKAKENIEKQKINFYPAVDFSDYCEEEYFSDNMIIPLKSSDGCYYKKCAFCTHHSNKNYIEYPLEFIENTARKSKKKYFFFIDDMLSRKRILEIAEIMKRLNARWWCQLKPSNEFQGIMNILYNSGLRGIGWGVESGSQKILDKMEKSTHVEEIEMILKESKDAGIINLLFIIFGFPGETKEDFLKTIDFLKRNSENIHLVSTSIFGLQKGSKIYENPENFGIYCIEEQERTILGNKITYKTKNGLSQEEAEKMRKNYIKTIKKIDKLPRVYNYFREHTIFL